MARSFTKPSQHIPPYLSQTQQDLLLAALNSQAIDSANSQRAADSDDTPGPAMSGLNGNGMFISPQKADLDNFDYTPELDYLDGNDFDFENADLGGEMIGALPGGAQKESHGDGHEKRKSPDENVDAPEGDAKRQETGEGEKSAKKPGRKPLTTEPTTKRKAQNRAAQRAFRERKEAHLKDLEQKVQDLTKSQEADKQENGMLKAQVERLQTELRDYRKRLSLNSSAVRSSPPLNPVNAQQRSVSGPSYGANFQFDFPKFGALPGSQLFGSQAAPTGNSPVLKQDSQTPPITQSPINIDGPSQSQGQNQYGRQNSMQRSMSPRSLHGSASNGGSPQNASSNLPIAPYSTNDNMHGFASTLPQMNGTNGTFGDLFSPNLLKSANLNGYFNNNSTRPSSQANHETDNGGDSTAGLNRVFQFNSSSTASDSTSPSASSSSQWNANGNANSSCGTSPESSHDSPALKDKAGDSFSEKINPRRQSAETTQSMKQQLDPQTGMNSMFGFGNTDFNAPSMASFDPVLFGDYRDTDDAILGGGNFTGGFFDDALNNSYDYNSPSNLFGILQSPQQTNASLNPGSKANSAPTPSRNLMAEVEKTCEGGDEDYGLPTTYSKKESTPGKFISCNNIWNQLQSNPDFQEGKFDLDGLCSELRAKAKCSESGVMVDQDHVDQALRRLGQKDDSGKPVDVPPLMFEQDSWDSVLKKLQNGNPV